MTRVAAFALAVVLATVFTGVPAVGSEPAAGNAVTRWAEHSFGVVRSQNVATPNAGRLYAMVTAAMYDAVNGIDRARGLNGREEALVAPAGAPVNGHQGVAAAAAAAAVLCGVAPGSCAGLTSALDDEIRAAGGHGSPAVAAGRDWGARVGREVLRMRSADGTQDADNRSCSIEEPVRCVGDSGAFHAPFDARWRNMTPFGVASVQPYRSPPPPPHASDAYAAAFDDVKLCGSSDADLEAMCPDPTPPAERDAISLFWLAEARTVRETGTWLQASIAIVEQRGTSDSISKTARLFALVGMGVADAVKLSWDTKARFFTWRPTLAIRNADADANPATSPDSPSGTPWSSRRVNGTSAIGGSPDYDSGTSTFAGAASAIIEGFYCDQPVPFSFSTDLAPRPRTYASPLEAAIEAGRARIFQGIHFQFSNEDGRRAGRAIGTEIVKNRLRRVGAGAIGDPCP